MRLEFARHQRQEGVHAVADRVFILGVDVEIRGYLDLSSPGL
jgi:hypothetical protein